MSLFFQKSGIVNVRMVITEEKILSNIEKVQKLINPKSKKQIVQLEDDSYFKDLIESIKTYLIEYPKKKNFPVSVYRSCYQLVEFATNQFEENTKKIEDLIRKREQNIDLAAKLKETLSIVTEKQKGWKEEAKKLGKTFSVDIIEALNVIGRAKKKDSENYQSALKLIEARINNLESNLHIEIDMERIEDKSKALSYIGIEIAEALKYIPAPMETLVPVTEEEIISAPVAQKVRPAAKNKAVSATKTANTKVVAAKADVPVEPKVKVNPIMNQIADIEEEPSVADDLYFEETRFEMKPSLWQRIKNCKIARAIRYITKIKIVIELPQGLPEGRGDQF